LFLHLCCYRPDPTYMKERKWRGGGWKEGRKTGNGRKVMEGSGRKEGR
jgi:hypothetical protein